MLIQVGNFLFSRQLCALSSSTRNVTLYVTLKENFIFKTILTSSIYPNIWEKPILELVFITLGIPTEERGAAWREGKLLLMQVVNVVFCRQLCALSPQQLQQDGHRLAGQHCVH